MFSINNKKRDINPIVQHIIVNSIRRQMIVSNRISKNRIKIICIGQPKTGTKTMKDIFLQLGKKCCSNPSINNDNDYILLDNNIILDQNNFFNNINYILKNLNNFDFFHDIPYSFNYKEIDNIYPNSKFILTLRDENEWFKSILNYQKIKNAVLPSILKVIYGHKLITEDLKEEIITKYNKYNNDIISYFSDKPEKLIIINICDKNKNEEKIIEQICRFINIDIPVNFNFPHKNAQYYT